MSGIFDLFKPTDPRPDNPGLAARLGRFFSRNSAHPADQGRTTEAGTSASASPSNEMYELWALRYERRAIIADIRKLMLDEPRLDRAVWKLGREAVRKGVTASVQTKAKRGPSAGLAKRAQAILDETIKDCGLTPTRLRSWAVALPAEGDLFIQKVVQGDRLVDAKRMPASSMERNTDAQDRFYNPHRAFSQVDIQTDATIADFAAWQVVHERWKHWDGERYGQSAFVQLRRPARNLMLMEQAQVIRRMVRAALRLFHMVGNKDNPGTAKDIADYKDQNSTLKASQGGFDPKNVAVDYYGNGNTSVTAIPGDPNLEKIDDLEYYQDLFVSGTGTPKAMIGLAAKDINRDILKQQIEEWLKEVQDLTDAIANIVRDILDTALMLKGIDPAMVEYVLVFSQNSRETALERQDRVSKARQNTLGTGINSSPDPLIPKRVAIQAIAEDYGFRDVDAVLAELDQEREADDARAQAQADAAAQLARSFTDPEDGADDGTPDDENDAPPAPRPRRVK